MARKQGRSRNVSCVKTGKFLNSKFTNFPISSCKVCSRTHAAAPSSLPEHTGTTGAAKWYFLVWVSKERVLPQHLPCRNCLLQKGQP